MNDNVKVAILPVAIVSVILIGAALGIWVSISDKPKRLRVRLRSPIVRRG